MSAELADEEVEPLDVTSSCDISDAVEVGSVRCMATATGGRPPYTYTWDFGDGSRGRGETVEHTYQGPGTFTIEVVATDGVEASGEKSGYFFTIVDPVLTFTAICSPTVLLVGQSTFCFAETQGGEYEWFFTDDQSTATGQLVAHNYTIPGDHEVRLTAHAHNAEGIFVGGFFHVFDISVVRLPATISVKPGEDTNSINIGSRGVTPVALLTTRTFHADSRVDPSTARFGRRGTEASPVHHAPEDVDGDGDQDLIFHFATEDLGLRPGDSEVRFTGETRSGLPFEGTGRVRAFGARGSPGARP